MKFHKNFNFLEFLLVRRMNQESWPTWKQIKERDEHKEEERDRERERERKVATFWIMQIGRAHV